MIVTEIRQRLILLLITKWPDGENMNVDELSRCTTDELLCVLENSLLYL